MKASALITITFLLSRPAVSQQKLRVRLLDGRSGKAITAARVTINTLGDYRVSELQAVVTGDHYEITLHGEVSVGVGNVTRSQQSWNEYVLCANGDDRKPIFSVAEIVAKGLVAPNTCGAKINATPIRGEIVFFLRPLTLWERVRDFRLPS